MSVPPTGSVKTNVKDVVGFDKRIGKSRTTDGTENEAALFKRAIDRRPPPAFVTKLDCVNECRIELCDDTLEPRRAVFIARRKLKQKTTKFLSENLLNLAEFSHQPFGMSQTLLVRDQSINFDGVSEIIGSISPPCANRGVFWPGIKRRVKLNRVEVRDVMFEPCVSPLGVRIKDSTPVPIEPSRTTHMDFHALIVAAVSDRRII